MSRNSNQSKGAGARLFAIVLGVIAVLSGVTYVAMLEKVEAGYVGIRVDLLGTDQGVSNDEVGPGRYWIGINEDLYKFPTFAVNYVWTQDRNEGSATDESLTFQSVEGMNVSADVGITYSVDPEMVSDLFQRYRKGIEEITDIYLRNAVRDALVSEASTMQVRQIYGEGKTGLMARVEERVIQQVARYGINVERIYWIGGLRLPPNVVASIDSEIAATAQARQRENEVAEAIAAADKARETAAGEADAILAIATAQAEANRLLEQSLTENVIRYQATQKWDGVLPQVTGGATPLINLNELAQ